MNSPSKRPSPALVVALLALVCALTPPAYAVVERALGAGTVGTKQLKRAAVTTPKIRNGAVTVGKLAPKARPQLPLVLRAANPGRVTPAASFQDVLGVTVPAGTWLAEAKGIGVAVAGSELTCDLMAGPSFIADRTRHFVNAAVGAGAEVHSGFALLNVVTLSAPTRVFMQCRASFGTQVAVDDTKIVVQAVRGG